MHTFEFYDPDNRWRRRHPAEKAALAGGMLILAVALPPGLVSVWILAIMSAATVFGARVGWQRFLGGMFVPVGFLLVGSLSLLVSIDFRSGHSWPTLTLVESDAWRVLLRGLAATSCLIFFTTTTSVPDLLSLLHRVRCPEFAIELMMLTYRFALGLAQTARGIRLAQRLRLGYGSRATGFRSLALLAGSLLPRSLDRAMRLDPGPRSPGLRRAPQRVVPRSAILLGRDRSRSRIAIRDRRSLVRNHRRCRVNEPPLDVCDVRFHYSGGVHGLDGAALTLQPGEKIALLGPNGCGKTTLLLHLCGVLRPRSGEVRLFGKPVEYTKAGLRELRRNVGTVLQDADEQLFAGTVYQDVSFGPVNLKLPESEVRQRVDEALHSLGITELGERPPSRLSLGQKKRAALAGVVAMRPKVIVLDEPTAGLDPAGVVELLEILDRLQRDGTTIAFATHDVDLAYNWADRVAVMNRGRVEAVGRPVEIFFQQELLDRARLQTPWMVSVIAALRRAGVWPAGESPPHSVAELLKRLEELAAC